MTASPDSEWHYACARADLGPGDKREIELPGGKIVLLVMTDEGAFACCADCPHQETPLIEADLDGAVLTCPQHFWQWDLRSGAPLGIAELPLPTFPVEERGGALYIGLRRS
jgi:toluene monooxygenase system ferredoxin subunit